jgi:N-methylhydantoinase A
MDAPGSPRGLIPVTASVDVGGTFTDVIIQRGEHIVSSFKVLTTPQSPEIAVLESLQRWSGGRIGELVHATTLGSNALLSRRGSRATDTGLVTTRGFADVIEIGRQNRSELYNLEFERPEPLVSRRHRYELEERVLEAGVPVPRLREQALVRASKQMKRDGVRSVAISFLHSFARPVNERRAAKFLRRSFPYVSVSSEIAPEPREYERTSTAVVNATLLPVVSDYMGRLEGGLAGRSRANVSVMASSGGLISMQEVRRKPVQIIESGPAAGVIAASELARLIGIRDAISFDMGGTTAKAGTITEGMVETTSELEVGGTSHHGRKTKGSGYPVRFPFVDLVEVSAGGGTIISKDSDEALAVGPESAGAEPGPACYGRGGTEPTLTDANLVAGILGGQMLGGALRLDADAARRSLQRLGEPMRTAEAALRLADLEMSRAIRMVTVERGLDPTKFVLIAFGGAGPQHAANLARELGIRKVVVPPRPGLFSALGLLHSDWRFEERMAFPTDPAKGYARLESRLRAKHPGSTFLRSADCRYAGQGSELTIKVDNPSRQAIVGEFERVHQATFGFQLDRSVEIVVLRVFAVLRRSKPTMSGGADAPLATGSRPARVEGRTQRIRTYNRAGLASGKTVRGPSCIEDYDSTIFLPPGWKGNVGKFGQFSMEGRGK